MGLKLFINHLNQNIPHGRGKFGKKRGEARSNSRDYYTKNRIGLYPGYPNRGTKKLILTESVIDTASLLNNKEITESYALLSLYGTNGLTAEHIHAIQQIESLEGM